MLCTNSVVQYYRIKVAVKNYRLKMMAYCSGLKPQKACKVISSWFCGTVCRVSKGRLIMLGFWAKSSQIFDSLTASCCAADSLRQVVPRLLSRSSQPTWCKNNCGLYGLADADLQLGFHGLVQPQPAVKLCAGLRPIIAGVAAN